MHISEGVLSPEILIAGAALTAGGVAIGLKQVKNEEIPSLGILGAAFFVASLIHVPAGIVSVHLVLNGLLGLILGWKAFPAILVGLALQALLFQFGGLTTLGVNTFNMAASAVISYYLFRWGIRPQRSKAVFVLSAFGCGGFAVMLAGGLVGLSLYLNGEGFLEAAGAAVVAHVPVILIEGALTVACALFLKGVRPELLEGKYAPKQIS